MKKAISFFEKAIFFQLDCVYMQQRWNLIPGWKNFCLHVGTGVFLWILSNFQKHLFYRTPLGEGRRLKQIEISIISKLRKENNNKKKIKMFLHFLFFTIFYLLPFSFQTSLFTKRRYVSLYSDFHHVERCWIWKPYLNTYAKN